MDTGGILLKNIIKRSGIILLSLIILLISCGFADKNYNPKTYDTERIMSIIEELTSKEYNGRMAGSEDGKKTEEYVAAKFKEIGLEPGGNDGTYFQEFSGISGNASGPYILDVLDGDKLVKSYSYAVDYKFATSLSHSGEVIGKLVEVNLESGNIPKASGEVALLSTLNIQGMPQDPKPLNDLYEAGYRGAIVARSGANSRIKGQMGFFDNSMASKLPRVAVTPEVYSELSNYGARGYKIHLRSAFEVKNFTANNVIGVLKSSAPTDKCLVISGHMDHLGPDPDGAYFPGALDNASGTACVIEIARALKKQAIKPDINIVFIAFSGEEEMLYGSQYYVSHPLYSLKNTKNINLDMVGAKSELPMSIAVADLSRGGLNSNEFAEEFRGAAEDMKSKCEVIDEDASDHSPFALSGAPAVTIIDLEKTIYHVPEDTIDNIGVDNLKRDIDVTMEVIGKEAYVLQVSGAGISIWIYVIAGGGVILILSAGIIYWKNKKIRVS